MAITVTISGQTAAQGTEMGIQMGKFLHPGTNATKPEVEAWLRGVLLSAVRDQQKGALVAAVATPPDFDTV
jgi:hypothetical protein